MSEITEDATVVEDQLATLPPVKLYNRAGGSFFWPWPSSTAEHCISFWSSVEVPDEIISQFVSTYHERRKNEVAQGAAQRTDEWKQKWLQENPKPRFKTDDWEAKFQSDRAHFTAQVTDELTNERPMKLGLYDARQLILAAQMLYHLPDSRKFPAENIKVRDHAVELYQETLTVEQINDKYKLFSLHYALERVFEDPVQKQILQCVRDLNSNMSVLSEEVIDARRESVR
jgi:hypothetical protein